MSKLLVVLIAWAITQSFGGIAQAGSEEGYANLSVNPASYAELAEKNGWIWTRQRETEPWRKLIPGQCPQWTRDGTRFYYFLAVGYDGGRSELWSAGADGEGRLRLTQSDYWVRRPVVVSPEERSMAFYFETSVSAGDFHDVIVIDFRPISVRSSAGRVVLRTHGNVDPSTLRWIEEGRLSVVADGKTVEVDTNLPGLPQDP